MSGLTEEAYQALKAKNKPTVEAPQESATPPVETEPIEPQAQTEAPTEQIEAEPNDGEPVQKEEPVAKGWDDDEPVVETKSEINLDWVSDLGLGEIKTTDEVKTKVTELKSKLKQLEEQPLEGLSDELKEVVKIAKTGDWRDYLASQLIDYSRLDPLEEFERDFIKRAQNNPKYLTDGKYDHQKVLDTIDALPEATREFHGTQIIQAEVYKAEQQRAAIKAKAEARKSKAEKSLAQSAKQLSEILPLETYGIKFEPRHSSEIYDGIVSSKLTKKHLGVSYDDLVRSGADMKAITRTITLAEKGERMIAFKSDNKATETKKDLLSKVQNVQLNPTSTPPNPETPEAKPKSPVELMKEYRQKTMQVGL